MVYDRARAQLPRWGANVRKHPKKKKELLTGRGHSRASPNPRISVRSRKEGDEGDEGSPGSCLELRGRPQVGQRRLRGLPEVGGVGARTLYA